MRSFEATKVCYLLLMSICTYGILQVHCSQRKSKVRHCYRGETVEEVCHQADRRCAMGRDIPNSTTTTPSPTTSTTTGATPSPGDVEISITFKFKCLDQDPPYCSGKFEIDSPFTIQLQGGNQYHYQCSDIFRVPTGNNSYAKGLRISTILWRVLSAQNYFSNFDATQKWISCPNVRSAIEHIVVFEAYPLPPQPIEYTCWCYGNDDPLCMEYLNKHGPVFGSCYTVKTPLCHRRLCEDIFGFQYSHLDFDELESY